LPGVTDTLVDEGHSFAKAFGDLLRSIAAKHPAWLDHPSADLFRHPPSASVAFEHVGPRNKPGDDEMKSFRVKESHMKSASSAWSHGANIARG